jgi:hypothetical protein
MQPWIPGGFLIAGIGGFVNVQGVVGPNGSYVPGAVPVRLHVGRWAVNRIYRNEEVTHSGSYGAILRRRVGLDYQFRAEIPFDLRTPPDMLLESGNSVALTFWMGASESYPTDRAEYNVASAISVMKRRCYWTPSALLDVATPVCDSTGTRIIRYDVQGSGNSLMFMLPDEIDQARAYLAYEGLDTIGGITLPTDSTW